MTHTIIIFVFFLELIFFFIPKSHFFGNTLASKNWHNYYQDPINSYGYHDKEPCRNHKKTILFLGDSFTQGHGIKNINDRFSNRLENLNNSFCCINIGKNGYDTKQEYNALLDFTAKSKIKPKMIVLQYFGNDIEGVAYSKLSKKNNDPYQTLNPVVKLITKGSYLINYLYWLYPHSDYSPYLNFLKKAYSSKEIINEHYADLNKIVDFSKKNRIELKIIIFPFLVDPKMSSIIYEEKIENFFTSKDVEVLNVSHFLNKIDKQLLIVNKNDGHASILVNEIVSKELNKLLK